MNISPQRSRLPTVPAQLAASPPRHSFASLPGVAAFPSLPPTMLAGPSRTPGLLQTELQDSLAPVSLPAAALAPEAHAAPSCSGWQRYRRPSDAARQYIAAGKTRASFGGTDACKHITWQDGAVGRAEKEALLGQRGCVIWFTGLSGSGKSTVAIALEHALAAHGRLTTLLDGDNLRHGLNSNLGFSAADRAENIRRVGEVSRLMMESGLVTIASFISPYQRDREAVRARMPPGDFIEVYMDVPLVVCEQRDPKGLYAMARAGKIPCFTGVSDPYEVPPAPEVVLPHLRADGSPNSPDDMAATVVDFLRERGFLPPPAPLSGSCGGG